MDAWPRQVRHQLKKILPFHGICSEYHKKKSMLKDNQPTAMDYFT